LQQAVGGIFVQVDYPITWLYYEDLDSVVPFYRDVLGLELVRDQGWAKIFGVNSCSYIGLVDEKHGSVDAAEDKPVLVTLVVEDVDGWYEHLKEQEVPALTEPKHHGGIGVHSFFFEDPAGYKLEVQTFDEPLRG
jgi:catechol 2,3-dioxygenase-like lactoylglutathione lyase family enzyme